MVNCLATVRYASLSAAVLVTVVLACPPAGAAEFTIPSPRMQALRLPLPPDFSESSRIVFPEGSMPASSALYCTPHDAELAAERLRGRKVEEPARIGCITVLAERSTPAKPQFDAASGRFLVQEYAESMAKIPASPRRGAEPAFVGISGMHRWDVGGMPAFAFAEEWSGPLGRVKAHHLRLFDGQDVWAILFPMGRDEARGEALWQALLARVGYEAPRPVPVVPQPIASADALGAAMERARQLLASKSSWAANLSVAEVRRRGGSMLVRVPLDEPGWKPRWEPIICEVAELKRIMALNGGVVVYERDPIEGQRLFFTKADCYQRNPEWKVDEK